MANEILSMQDPKEIQAAFLRLVKSITGKAVINDYTCLNAASILDNIDGIDVEKLYRKAQVAYIKTQDYATAEKIRDSLILPR